MVMSADQMDFSSTTLDSSVRMVSQSLSFTSTLIGMAVINSEAEGSLADGQGDGD